MRVRVKDQQSDALIANAYVALVPPHQPWSRPLAETVTTTGTATIEVPAGEYLLLAGAPGHGVTTHGPLSIMAGDAKEIDVRLPSTRIVSGTVRDAGGKPLRGVTVADVNAVVEAPLGRLSSLAKEHLASSWQTTSAEDGSWTLSLPAGSNNPLIARREHYAGAWFDNTTAREAIRFALKPGSRLRARLNRTDPGFVITVLTADVQSVPQNWQGQVRARRTGNAVLEWDSLPAGPFEMYAQQVEPRAFTAPVKIAAGVLPEAATTEVAIDLPPLTSASKTVATALVRKFARTALDELEVVGVRAGGAPAVLPSSVEDASGGTAIYFDAAGAHPPYHARSSNKFVAIAADVPNAEGVLSTTVFRRAEAGLHVRPASPQLALPAAGTATFHRCQATESVVTAIAVRKDGTAIFDGPADCSALSIQLSPFGRLLIQKSLAAAAPQTWLGEFSLFAGGSAGVHVVAADGAPVADAKVVLSAPGVRGGEPASIASAPTAADGWAYFDELPAGRELSASASTFSGDSTALQRFVVQPLAQTIVDPLLLQRSSTLVLKVKLDAGVADAYRESAIDTVFLDRDDLTLSSGHVRGERQDEETFRFERLQPGRWRVTALVAIASARQPIEATPVEVAGGEGTELSREVKPYVFRGRVATRKGEPVAGNLDVIGSQRSDVVPSINTSAQGEFVAVVPRLDTYQVAVRTRNPPAVHWLGDVELTDPSRPINLTLPGAEVVVAARMAEKPAANVTISASMLRDGAAGLQVIDAWGITDAAGELRLDGLLPGTWLIEATDETQHRHAAKRVVLTEAKPAHLEVDLSSITISGAVRQPYGAPVGGARVSCVVPADGVPPRIAEAFTSDDGTFDLSADASMSRAALCAVTSFVGADAFRVASSPVTLSLPATPGTLEVNHLPPINRYESLWLLAPDGRLLDVTPFVLGSSMTIPALAPNRWRLVRVRNLPDWLALTSGAPLPAIVTALVEPGKRVSLDVVSSE
ncbi:MAG TPA: carboxypeptidase-like regulatory domain-containing protein [Thermoanaerobaculia bacterium]|nr:carboxypeptidase-like regulatory domain-containing protein [Thermoanaerobaculia bacterium]